MAFFFNRQFLECILFYTAFLCLPKLNKLQEIEPDLNCQVDIFLNNYFDCTFEFYGYFDKINITIRFDDNEEKNIEYRTFNVPRSLNGSIKSIKFMSAPNRIFPLNSRVLRNTKIIGIEIFSLSSVSLTLFGADYVECDQANTPSCKEYFLGNFGAAITRKIAYDNVWSSILSVGYKYYTVNNYIVTNQTDLYFQSADNLVIAICPAMNTLYDFYSTGTADPVPGQRSFLNLQKVDSSSYQRLCLNIVYEDDYQNKKNILGFNKTFNLFGLFDINASGINFSSTKTIAINKIKNQINKMPIKSQIDLNCTNDIGLKIVFCMVKLKISDYGSPNETLNLKYNQESFIPTILSIYYVPKNVLFSNLASCTTSKFILILINNIPLMPAKLESIEMYANKSGQVTLAFLEISACNDVTSCSNYFRSKIVSFSRDIMIQTFYLNAGYNQIALSNLYSGLIQTNYIPILIGSSQIMSDSAYICVDVSIGTTYSDLNGYIDKINNTISPINPILIDDTWRYYVRIYYDYDFKNIDGVYSIYLSKRYYNTSINSVSVSLLVKNYGINLNKTQINMTNTYSEASTFSSTTTQKYTTETTRISNTLIYYSETSFGNSPLYTTQKTSLRSNQFFTSETNRFSAKIANFNYKTPNDTFILDQLNFDVLLEILKTTDLNDCLSNCSNRGSCQKSNGKYICLCDNDYTGSRCQVNTRPCSFNPCLNNSTCLEYTNNLTLNSGSNNISYIHNQSYSYECLCNKNFYGDKCEYSIDFCINETCSGNGNCIKNMHIENNYDTSCECFYLYEGNKCETESSKLITVKIVIKTASIIAIITLVLFYSLFIISDLSNLKIDHKQRNSQKYLRNESKVDAELKPVYIY